MDMSFHEILNVSPLPDYMLKLQFDTGESKIFDVKPYIRGTWYIELKDPGYFKRVAPSGISVEWPNGQDIDPCELYGNSKPF
jgi:hypothetical protein